MFPLEPTNRPTLPELLAKSKSRGAAALLCVRLEDLERMICEAQSALDVDEDFSVQCSGLN